MLDVRDLSDFADGSFDAVVAYGGPLSYAFDQAEAAFADPQVWPRLLDWEAELAAEPGMLDGGTHILFAVERT